MPIAQNIPRKQGLIFSHPKKSSVNTRVFGFRGNAGANVGDVVNPGNPKMYSDAGVDYNSGISHTGGAKNPVGNHSNTATQLDVPQLSTVGQTTVMPQAQVPEVQPHEKGTFFSPVTSSRKANPQRQSGGVDANADTPFHPAQPVKPDRQKRYPAKAGERTTAASFGTQHTLAGGTGNSQGITAHGGGTIIGQSRWGTLKRGAAESPVLHHGTLAGPSTRGIPVASGTTGTTSTGSSKNPHVRVASNAHSGSPFVVAWVPNKRGEQPNEKGVTFPLRQSCKNGCAQTNG